MTRKETTDFLSNILIKDRFNGIGKYWAREVVLDYGTIHPKRVDFLQYIPRGAIYVGEIENGTFVCYEIKSCKEDFYSGNGLNFFAEENYIVTTVECYKSLLDDMRNGKFAEHLYRMNDGRTVCPDFLLAVPDMPLERFSGDKAVIQEMDKPTPLDKMVSPRLAVVRTNHGRSYRTRSTTELLFCMVRSGRTIHEHRGRCEQDDIYEQETQRKERSRYDN